MEPYEVLDRVEKLFIEKTRAEIDGLIERKLNNSVKWALWGAVVGIVAAAGTFALNDQSAVVPRLLCVLAGLHSIGCFLNTVRNMKVRKIDVDTDLSTALAELDRLHDQGTFWRWWNLHVIRVMDCVVASRGSVEKVMKELRASFEDGSSRDKQGKQLSTLRRELDSKNAQLVRLNDELKALRDGKKG